MSGFLDLSKHDLLVVVYPHVICQFFEFFLEELVTILVGHLLELLPLRVFDLCMASFQNLFLTSVLKSAYERYSCSPFLLTPIDWALPTTFVHPH